VVELVGSHESEIDFGFKTEKAQKQPLKIVDEFNRTFGGSDESNPYSVQRAYSVQPVSDGGYILAGMTYVFGGVFDDAWLIKTDAQGNDLME
jgi:hypothetical protein